VVGLRGLSGDGDAAGSRTAATSSSSASPEAKRISPEEPTPVTGSPSPLSWTSAEQKASQQQTLAAILLEALQRLDGPNMTLEAVDEAGMVLLEFKKRRFGTY
jgi:hypothetical protein